MNIIGAGLAGLLAGHMLRHHDPELFEVQRELPNNHSAVLRFRTSAVGDVCNIPFRKVTMIKGSVSWRNPIADALAYSFKNTGSYRSDRSIVSGLVTAERWVAPSDLIARMAAPLSIKLGHNYSFFYSSNEIKVSTIPMPALMRQLDYKPTVAFEHATGYHIKAKIEQCDAYVSLLCPDPKIPFSRLSITGNELILETHNNDEKVKFNCDTYGQLCVSAASGFLGIPIERFHDIEVHMQRYAKINPIDDNVRKNFLWWATDKHRIFSLGRFATWRPQLLLDDLVNDLRKIDSWVQQGHYSIARHR